MATSRLPAAADDDVFALTEKGSRVLKSADTPLASEELQLLVLIDGTATVAGIAKRIPALTREALTAALRKLAADKLVVSTTDLNFDAMASGFSTVAVPAGFFSSLKVAGTDIDGSMSDLKRQGYHVSFGRRAAPREAKPGWRATILVVDDDPDLQKLFRTYLSLEGFSIRAALKRDDAVLGLTKQPRPDLVLLDVKLPDVNGFNILAKMRMHPAFKETPVIMLTAEATRDSVLKGLRGGANGYITKPFQPEALIGAVKAVLGLSPAEPGQKRK
jgi:two-component system, OmpR family, response regulator